MGRRGLIPHGLPLPRNASAIAAARQGGLRPAKPIVVSYVGDTPWDNPTVYADSGQRYDWSWAKDLEVQIVVKPGVDATDAVDSLFDPFATSYLGLIDIERKHVSFVVSLDPPVLWPMRDTTDYFPTEH